MKTATKQTPVIASEELTGSVMGMDAKGMDMATYFFRDKIYSDKIMAVVREYVCNAIDEHKKFGIDRPVEYGVKDGKFFVRDFANGLSEDGVRKIFGMYFRSTKSDTNESIGGFGVGSKAGHCYSDTFNVTSHHNGTKTIYSAVLGGGDNGVPVGTIYNLHSEPTNEQGIEIEVEIKAEDSIYFADKCVRFHHQSSSNITLELAKQTFKRNEIVDTFDKDGIVVKIIKTNDKANKWIQQDYRNRYNVDGFAIKMGDVTYSDSREENIQPPIDNSDQSYRVLVECPIGSLDIPVSRENLDETKRNERMIEKVEKVVGDYVRDRFSDYAKMSPDKFYLDQLSKQEDGSYVSSLKNSNGWLRDDRIVKGCSVKLDYLFNKYISQTLQSMAVFSVNLHDKPELCPETNKPILVLIPANNRTAPHWTQKVKWFEDLTGKQYFVLHFSQWSHTTRELEDDPKFKQEIEKHFVLTEAKKLKYPKQPKTKGGKTVKGYTVWKRGYKLDELYNPIQFHNMVMEEYNKEFKTKYAKVDTIEKAKQQIAKIKKDLPNHPQRESYLLISLQSSRRRYANTAVWFAQAAALKKGLLEMGYMEENYKEFNLIHTARQDEADKLNALYALLDKYFYSQFIPKRIKRLLIDKRGNFLFKESKHAIRLAKRLNKIATEESFRARIFAHCITGVGYSRNTALANQGKKLTRKDIRKVLTELN
jgi:hypothetical protein